MNWNWVLIIYMFSGNSFPQTGQTTAINKIEGFSSRQSCISASREISTLKNSEYLQTLCVEKK